jgi:septal ring factor EnvC (AmiA/AmiB activator)
MEKSTMQSNQKTILLMILLTSIFMSSGCLSGRKAVEAVVHPGPAEIQPVSHENVAKRFPESASGPTVVESAIELSDKYAKLSEAAAVVRQQNYELISKNKQIEDQLVAFEAQLRQTQKELTEANDILIEMRIELNNWKVDVLGFRDEMRDAETEQLRALLKILEILGGETKAESDQGKDTSLQTVSPANPGQSEP